MKLGAFSVSLAVSDIAASKAFYEKLGFEMFHGDLEQNWAMMRNGDHVIVSGGRNGPNLFGVLGRTAGTLPGYNFSQGLTEAGEAGLVYDVEYLTAYAANPNGFLGEFLDGNARSKMPLGFPDYAAAAAEFLSQISKH